MPTRDHAPVSNADRQARIAFREFTLYYQQKLITRAEPIDLAPRTYNRIFAGKRDVPPGAARELAGKIREMIGSPLPNDTEIAQLDGWAFALEDWADECQQRGN